MSMLPQAGALQVLTVIKASHRSRCASEAESLREFAMSSFSKNISLSFAYSGVVGGWGVGTAVDGGTRVDGVAVDGRDDGGTFVDGMAVEGIRVDGIRVDGIRVDGVVGTPRSNDAVGIGMNWEITTLNPKHSMITSKGRIPTFAVKILQL